MPLVLPLLQTKKIFIEIQFQFIKLFINFFLFPFWAFGINFWFLFFFSHLPVVIFPLESNELWVRWDLLCAYRNWCNSFLEILHLHRHTHSQYFCNCQDLHATHINVLSVSQLFLSFSSTSFCAEPLHLLELPSTLLWLLRIMPSSSLVKMIQRKHAFFIAKENRFNFPKKKKDTLLPPVSFKKKHILSCGLSRLWHVPNTGMLIMLCLLLQHLLIQKGWGDVWCNLSGECNWSSHWSLQQNCSPDVRLSQVHTRQQ